MGAYNKCMCGWQCLNWNMAINYRPTRINGDCIANVSSSRTGFINISYDEAQHAKMVTLAKSITYDSSKQYHMICEVNDYDNIITIRTTDEFGRLLEEYITSSVDISNMSFDDQAGILRRMGLAKDNDNTESNG